MVDIVTQEEEKTSEGVPSDGVKLVNRTLYTGIGFGVNEVSSLWITNQFVEGNNLFAKIPSLKKMGAWFSKEGFEKAGAWIAKTCKFSDKMGKDGKFTTSHERGKNALLMTTLLSGGTLLILPMKWLEDSKAYWVKKADHFLDWMRGSKMSDEQVAARDVEVEQYIACSPRQSWSSLLVGRVVAMCSSVATGTFLIGHKNNQALMDWSEQTFTGKIMPENHKGAPHSWRNYARLLSVETYSCAISSIVLEVMSKLFASKSSKVHDPSLCHRKLASTTTSADATTNPPADANTKPSNQPKFSAKIDAQRMQKEAAPVMAIA